MNVKNEGAVIKVWERENVNSRASKQLRRTGYVPAAISRKGQDSISIKVKGDEILRNLSKHGRNYLFTLDIEGKEPCTVMVKELYYSPVKRELLNVDFQQVSLSDEIKVDISIRLIGKEEAEFKKLLVMTQLDKIPVKGLPQDIPDYLEIDITNMTADDKVNVGDIQYPKGVVPDIETDKLVLMLSEARSSSEEETEADSEQTETEESES